MMLLLSLVVEKHLVYESRHVLTQKHQISRSQLFYLAIETQQAVLILLGLAVSRWFCIFRKKHIQ